jgi:hypothetical protein
MSDLLQEIKDYLDSIENNSVRASIARDVNEYEVCKKTVIDCKEAVLSLFKKLDREYWDLLERFGQAQAKIEQYEKARQSYLQACDELEAHANEPDIVLSIVSELRQALEGES